MLNPRFNLRSLLFAGTFLFAMAATFALAGGAPAFPAPDQAKATGAETEVQLAKEVRHVLVMQPFYTVFDNLEFKVKGEEVTLLGQVVKPALKSDAAAAVKRLEGVKSVKNEIQVLPPSPADNRIRLRAFHAIYSAPGFQKYAIQAVPPIHIIVNMGHLTLEGVVASQMDKTVAAMRAKQVPGTFSVTDNLRVEKQY